MSISTGDTVPACELTIVEDAGPVKISSGDFFKGRTVVLFAVPGAFTPTCSARHLPGYKERAAEFAARGVDVVACTSVNDHFVMKAWGKDQGLNGEIVLLADGSADFARTVGLELDASGFGMGTRSQRYAMIVRDGVVSGLFVEAKGEFRVSAAEVVLDAL